MSFVRDVIAAFGGKQAPAEKGTGDDRRKPRIEGEVSPLPPGVLVDRRSSGPVFGKAGALPARHRE